MTEFVSEVKTIPFNEDRIFNMLSDLSNLGKVQDRIPQDKIQDFEFDKDSCSFSVAPVGKITFQIVEREPNSSNMIRCNISGNIHHFSIDFFYSFHSLLSNIRSIFYLIFVYLSIEKLFTVLYYRIYTL